MYKRYWPQLTETRAQQLKMYKNQPQMYKYEFSSLQLPVGWRSVFLGFIATTPFILL